jgi:hypothetical protein
MHIGHMLVAGQRMADHDRIGPFRIERAIGLIGDRKWRQRDAGIQLERRVRAKFSQQRALFGFRRPRSCARLALAGGCFGVLGCLCRAGHLAVSGPWCSICVAKER